MQRPFREEDGPRAARLAGLLAVRQAANAAGFFAERVAALLATQPEVAAVFGSYDAHPPAGGLVSRYKSLLHHFVHQQGAEEGSTFWAGCGAIRRVAFEAVGGFDQERFRHPSIEEIELGYRLRRAGHRILLDRALQGTHLKRWTLRDLLWTDVARRAAPWSRLILESRGLIDDLNLRWDQRLSAVLVGLATPCLALGPLQPWLLAASAAAFAGVGVLNRRPYRFLAQQDGLGFAVVSVLLHWRYHLYSGVTFVGMWASVAAEARGRGRGTAQRTR